MKRIFGWLGVVAALAAAILLLRAIISKIITPGEGKCRRGICIAIRIEEPIPYDQPVPVTVTVTTNRDISGLEIGIASPQAIIVEGNYEITDWGVVEEIDTQAGIPQGLTITVRFTLEGRASVNAYARDRASGAEVVDGLLFYMTTSGGTFDFPPAQTIQVTVIAVATPTPTPLPPYEPSVGRRLPRLKPDEVLSECGWSQPSLPPTEWELDGANIWTTIPERVELGEPVEILLGIEVPDDQAAGPADLVICMPDPENSPFEILGESAWHLTVQSGDLIQVTTTLRFTREGWADAESGLHAWYRPDERRQHTWVAVEPNATNDW
jgi:hypothetical protein